MKKQDDEIETTGSEAEVGAGSPGALTGMEDGVEDVAELSRRQGGDRVVSKEERFAPAETQLEQ